MPVEQLLAELLAERPAWSFVLDHEEPDRPGHLDPEPRQPGGEVRESIDGEGCLAGASVAVHQEAAACREQTLALDAEQRL